MRRHYSIRLTVNGRLIEEIVIDPHYEEKHSKAINDELILHLVSSHLDDGVFQPIAVGAEGHEYFSSEPLYCKGKPYRLVWLLPPIDGSLGVVNCFRRSYGKGKNHFPR